MSLSVVIFKTFFIFNYTYVHMRAECNLGEWPEESVGPPETSYSCKHPNMGSRNQTQDLCEDSKCFLAKSYLFSPSRGTVCEVSVS